MRPLRPILIVCCLLGLTVATAAQAPVGPPAAPQDYLFPSGTGLLFFHVRPERAQDFEAVVLKLGDVLDRTADPIRKQQAASWRVFRSIESPRDVVLYLFFFDPAVLGADYDPVKVLSEALPADVQGLYERLRADVIRVERMGLTKIR